MNTQPIDYVRRVAKSEPTFGILFNKGAIWIGGHYSPFNRRWCINLVPCITIWFTLRGGKAPQRAKM